MMEQELQQQLNRWEAELAQWKTRLITSRQLSDNPNAQRYVLRRIEDMQYHVRKSKEKLDYNVVKFRLTK